MLNELLTFRGARGLARSLKAVLLGGAPSRDEFLRRIVDLKIPTLCTYGATETAAHVTCTTFGELSTKLTSVGKPLRHAQIKILDEHGHELPPGEEGTIAVNSSSLFSAYLIPGQGITKRSEEWYRTNDMGYLDQEGYLFVTGKVEDLIISGGEKIRASEIVEQALRHQGIEQAVVIAVSHPRWGERPVLFVQPSDYHHFALNDLKRFLELNLPKIKVPDKIIPVKEIPRNETGKVEYQALRALAD